jgi:hypothetical protein
VTRDARPDAARHSGSPWDQVRPDAAGADAGSAGTENLVRDHAAGLLAGRGTLGDCLNGMKILAAITAATPVTVIIRRRNMA